MKKIFSLLLVVTLILSFCACGNTNSSTGESGSVSTGENWEKFSADDVLNRPAFATSKDKFKEKISTLIDVSKYECHEPTSSSNVIYSLIDKSKVTTKLDNSVKFYDGSVISLPTDKTALEEAGWTLQKEGGENTYDTYTNKNSDVLPLLENSIYIRSFYINDSNEPRKDDTSPDFKWGEITKSSTIEEILQFGIPTSISFNEHSHGSKCIISFDNRSGDVSADIYCMTSSNYIISFELEVKK